MNFMKKIWCGEAEKAHDQFVRFSKGIYKNRAVLIINKGKDKTKLKSSFEFANDFVGFVFSIMDKARISGILLSKEDNGGVKKVGLWKKEIDEEITKEQLEKILKNAYVMLFDIITEGILLKTKKKLPKPGKSGGKIDDKFCVLQIDNKFFPKFKEDFLFDLPEEVKKARISHDFIITEIILLKEEKDFSVMRKKARRQGKIVRKIEVDGHEIKKEKEFIA